MSVLNTKTVDEFVDTIRQSMETVTRSWVKIGEAFAEAREMFGSDSDSWRRLLKATKFASSTAHKLASIATSKRLNAYRAKLASVHSWGTLYAIHALPDDKFEELKRDFKLDDPAAVPPFITVNQIERIKKGKPEKTSLRLVASISIDEDALNGDLLSCGELQRLTDALEELRTTVPYLKVVTTGVIDASFGEYVRRLQVAAGAAERKALSRGIASTIARRKKPKYATAAQHEIACLGMSRGELFALYEANPKEAFDHLGLEYDEKKFQSDAESEVAKWTSRLAKRAIEAGNPYRYAGDAPDATGRSAAFSWLKKTSELQLQRVQAAVKDATADAAEADDDEEQQEAA